MKSPALLTTEDVTPRSHFALYWTFAHAWVLAKRRLVQIPRRPDELLIATIQPTMLVLLFRYVFGGAILVPGTRNENGSAKDVAEEQDEHGWLNSRDKQLVRTAWDLHESAFSQHPRVSERPIESEMGTRGNIFRGQECRAFHRFLLCSSASSGGSASLTARPVSEKKTSSSV